MNERMAELYRQAQVPYTAIDPSNNMPYETTCFSANKFAELIVRECSDCIKNGIRGYNIDQTVTKELCIKTINEHFGVEE